MLKSYTAKFISSFFFFLPSIVASTSIVTTQGKHFSNRFFPLYLLPKKARQTANTLIKTLPFIVQTPALTNHETKWKFMQINTNNWQQTATITGNSPSPR